MVHANDILGSLSDLILAQPYCCIRKEISICESNDVLTFEKYRV